MNYSANYGWKLTDITCAMLTKKDPPVGRGFMTTFLSGRTMLYSRFIVIAMRSHLTISRILSKINLASFP
jgi:hypothetical protein